ncbi:putative bifunctional diguanylate cyclase/phosphodiesterase [Lentisalinibacter sediminis]|uniref:putative bifunctional diguanylate cyclase/phosphodiesterase n=1 Tax=Lentisalinibacter sediminis TaxID=2992237 RepID=UPI00386D3DE8
MEATGTISAGVDFRAVGDALSALLPEACRIDFYGDDGQFVWSSAGGPDRDVTGALLSLPPELFYAASTPAEPRKLTLAGGDALHAFPLDDTAGRRAGVLACRWSGGGAGDFGPVAVVSRALPLLAGLFADRASGSQPDVAGAHAELDLLYDLEQQLEEAPHGQAQLAGLVRACGRHLDVGYSVLILPSKQIRIGATHRSWKGADRRALDEVIVRRFLPRLSRRRTPSVLDIATVPDGVRQAGDGDNDGYQLLLCPVRERGGRVSGVFALAGRTDGSSFGERERRFASLIARRAERVMESYYDGLTGLVNRVGFEAHLRESYRELAAEDDSHALVIFDLDKLQLVNDSFGHDAGDDILRRFAAELQKAVPHDGVATRLSGDNFGVLLHHCDVERAAAFAEEVRRRARRLSYLRGDKVVTITVSAGVAAWRQDSGGAAAALVAPKVACTAAKEHGRDRVEIYDQDDRSIIRRADDIRIVAHLQNALDRDEFELLAQPIAPLNGNGSAYHEVLLRMRGEGGEWLAPEQFLSAAERYQLMPRLDRWVVGRALEQVAGAPVDAGHVFAINLSGQSLGDDEFLGYVRERVEASGVPPAALCFEITETAAVANMDRAAAFIATMRELGCRFSLDDFGAGLSSFAYLKDFDVDTLKIDGSFVRDVTANRVSEAMIAAITQVARVMGLATVAEYVTSDPIRRKVRELGVDYAQGYHIGEPTPLTDVVAGLADAERVAATAT